MRNLWPNYENWRNWEQSSSCTGTTLSCTGTTWPKMTRNEIVPVQLQIVPVQVPQNALKCVFSHIFPYVSTPINSTLQTPIKTTPKSSWNLFSFQFLFQFHIFLQKSIMDFFQNPSNMSYNPYTIANIRIS